MAKRDVAAPPAAEIEREIENTRAELGRTLDALARQLAPNHLLKEGIDMIAQYAGSAALRANWAPLALIAVGIGWLVARHTDIARRSPPEKGSDLASGRAIGSGLQPEGGIRPGDRATPGSGLLRRMERHPLLIGLAGVASGAAISALLPPSKPEEEWSETARDLLWSMAEEIGHNAASRLRRAVERPALDPDLSAAEEGVNHRVEPSDDGYR